MKQRTIHADCFHVENLRGNLEHILTKINSVAVRDRNVEIDGQPFRIEVLKIRRENGQRIFEGDFIKVRMDNLPVKASKHSGVSNIGLSDNEGIGEETAFIYSPQHQVLLLQRNRNGASYLRVQQYLNKIGNGTDIVGLSIMINGTALEKLEAAETLTSISIAVVPETRAHGIDYGESVAQAIDVMKQVGGKRLSFTISLGARRDATLAKDVVKNIIRKLLRARAGCESCVKKVELRGRDDDGAMVIDFIKDRMSFSDVVANDQDRHLSYRLRSDFLRRAWNHTDLQRALRA